MGIISEARDTYRYARKEVSQDYAKFRPKKDETKKKKSKKKIFGIKRGKSIQTEKVVKNIKKKLPQPVYKRGKFQKKNIKNIKKEAFNVDLNLRGLY